MVDGTIFPHKEVHKGTWRSPDGVTVNQINHIAIFSRHRSSVLDVRALRGADIGVTGHYLVRGKIKVKVSKVSNFQATRLYDIGKLGDERVREEFRRAIDENRHDLNESDLELQWSKRKDAIKETPNGILGFKKGHKEEWISNETWDLI